MSEFILRGRCPLPFSPTLSDRGLCWSQPMSSRPCPSAQPDILLPLLAPFLPGGGRRRLGPLCLLPAPSETRHLHPEPRPSVRAPPPPAAHMPVGILAATFPFRLFCHLHLFLVILKTWVQVNHSLISGHQHQTTGDHLRVLQSAVCGTATLHNRFKHAVIETSAGHRCVQWPGSVQQRELGGQPRTKGAFWVVSSHPSVNWGTLKTFLLLPSTLGMTRRVALCAWFCLGETLRCLL